MTVRLVAALLGAAPQAGADLPCDASAAQKMVGDHYGRHSRTRIREATGSKAVRVVLPGTAVTQEFRDDRATVHVDHDRHIAEITCS